MKLLIAGDFCPQERVSALFEERQYKSVFEGVKGFFDSADYRIVNLECPIIKNDFLPIKKSGANLGCSESAIAALAYLGVDLVTLANNHFRDFGDEGCNLTMNMLRNNGISFTGGGGCLSEASENFSIEKNNLKIAIINACEEEYSIAARNQAGSAPLNMVDLFYRITDAKEKSDFVIVITHGGVEHYNLPTPQMKKNYRCLIDYGADIVINHHQHCYTGYEDYANGVIFYGLGNFCFDKKGKKNNIWNNGYFVQLDIKKGHPISYSLVPYEQCSGSPCVMPLENHDSFSSDINRINSVILDDIELEKQYKRFDKKTSSSYDNIVVPFSNKYLRKICTIGLFPYFTNVNKWLYLRDMLTCESHRNRYIDYINRKINNE